jgi:hypothetical protein|tara:strand:- start:1576 stop:1803 length:228 start_codon:yes stop_codon:yes gene_type:complete
MIKLKNFSAKKNFKKQATPDHAMKCEINEIPLDSTHEELVEVVHNNEKYRNSIIGKALEPLTKKQGKIMALITLQ